MPNLRHRLLLLAAAVGLLAFTGSASAGTRSQTASLTSNHQVATLTPTCGRHLRASGGGFQTTPPNPPSAPTALVFESRKTGQRGWRVSAQEVGNGPLTITAYVYCRKHAPKTKAKKLTLAVPSTLDFTTVDARCGHAGRARAGGFSAPVPSTLFAPVVESFRAAKKTWRTRAYGSSGSTPLTTYVYCAHAHSLKAASGTATSNVDEAQATAISGLCTRGKTPLAGGFSQPDAVLFTGFFVFPWESFRTGKSWRASAQHAGTSSTTLKSIAYCG